MIRTLPMSYRFDMWMAANERNRLLSDRYQDGRGTHPLIAHSKKAMETNIACRVATGFKPIHVRVSVVVKPKSKR